MQEVNEQIGQRIKQLREERGVTQKDIAKHLGYSPMGVSYFESGSREIKINDLQKIAEFFGKPISHFLTTGQTLFRAEHGTDEEGVQKSLSSFEDYLAKRKLSNE